MDQIGVDDEALAAGQLDARDRGNTRFSVLLTALLLGQNKIQFGEIPVEKHQWRYRIAHLDVTQIDPALHRNGETAFERHRWRVGDIAGLRFT